MIAIILAAWEGHRLKPLSNTMPKPMIPICGKSIMEHNIEKIYKYVSEIIIVVKYKKEVIIDALKENYKWTKITYHEQNDEKWTAAAIRWIDRWINDILILNGDSLFDEKDINNIIHFDGYWSLVKEVDDPKKYWIYKQNSKGCALEIIEKPEIFVWNLANVWVYKFNQEIIEISKNVPLSQRGEYEITDSINEFLKRYDVHLIPLKGKFIDVWYPWDILWANKHLLETSKESIILWEIEPWVIIEWKIILQEWVILKSGSSLQWNIFIGKNTFIWSNVSLKWTTVIWENCHIWDEVEINNSSLWNYTKVENGSYIWYSILWNDVIIGEKCITKDEKEDNSSIHVMIKWECIDSKIHKLWVIIWSYTKINSQTLTLPGKIIENNCIL